MVELHEFPLQRRGAAGPLTVSLVNFMPRDACKHTERQFRTILAAAARGRAIELRVLPLDVAVGACVDAAPDALIVTGACPAAARLVDEPAWPMLTRLIDFAAAARLPAMWSCLAAHAAVLHLDGIERIRRPRKLSAVVDCVRTDSEHWLARGLPDRWRLPHSRCNELPESALRARDYRIISGSESDGVDIFVKESGVPFVFCQGHPEYDADTLLREYRRDIREFLAGVRTAWPDPPEGLLGRPAIAELAAFRARAEPARDIALLSEFPWESCAATLTHAWHDLTIALYANWIDHLVLHRAQRRFPLPRRTYPARPLVLGAAGAT